MKLSVLVTTYNHEDYISQALESILMQQVNFDYEIVIGEDFSTDNTRNILLDYQRRYPDKIRLILQGTNKGVVRNFVQTYKVCEGEYIATLDGDDYWTSPQKMQKQIDFLDGNKDFSFCFHAVKILYQDDQQDSSEIFPENPKEIFTLEDIVKGNFIPSSSVIFRNGLFGEFPGWFWTVNIEDWPLNVLNAQYGKIMFLKDIMGVYRIHSGSVWSTKKELFTYPETIKVCKCIDSHFNFKYKKIIRPMMDYYYYKVASLNGKIGNIGLAKKYAIKSIFCFPHHEEIQYRRKFTLMLKLQSPLLYDFLRRLHVYVKKNIKLNFSSH